MKYVIVTGANRGIGLAMAKQMAVDADTHIIAVGRHESTENGALEKTCQDVGATLTFVRVDIGDIDNLQETITNGVFAKVNRDDATSIVLVQNAGIADTVLIGEQNMSRMRETIAVNFTATCMMSELFVVTFQSWPIEKKLFAISSGAARRPVQGWGTYCATKAGMEMFCQVLFEEQADQEFPIVVCSFGPGVVETDLQKRVRSCGANVPVIKRLKEMHEKGQARSPEVAAKIMYDYMQSKDFGKKAVEDAYNIAPLDNY